MPYFKQLLELVETNDIAGFSRILNEAEIRMSPDDFKKMLNHKNEHGRSLLHLSTQSIISELLLSKGANIANFTDPEQYSVLDLYLRQEKKYTQEVICLFIHYVFEHKKYFHPSFSIEKLLEIAKIAHHRGERDIHENILKRNTEGLALFINLRAAILTSNLKQFSDIMAQIRSKFVLFNLNQLDADKRTLLDSAICKENAIMVSGLLAVGADPNKPSGSDLRVPLARALDFLYKNESVMASFAATGDIVHIITHLVNQCNIDLKPIYEVNRSLLTQLAIGIKLSDFPKICSEKAALINRVKNVVLMGHRFDLKGQIEIANHNVNLEGCHLGISVAEVMQSYHEFLMSPEKRHELNALYNMLYSTNNINYFDENHINTLDLATLVLADLSLVSQTIDIKTLKERHTHNQVTPVLVNTKVNSPVFTGSHAISYVFSNDYCIRFNCGFKAFLGEISGMTVHTIGNKEEFWKNVPTILNSIQRQVLDTDLINHFHKVCALTPIFSVNFPEQMVGNCTYKAAEGIIFSEFFMHIFNHFKRPDSLIKDTLSECLHWAEIEAKKFFELFLAFDKNRNRKLLSQQNSDLPNALRCKAKESIAKIQDKERRKDRYWLPSFNSLAAVNEPKQKPLAQELKCHMEGKIVEFYQLYHLLTKHCREQATIDTLLEIIHSDDIKRKQEKVYQEFIKVLPGVESIHVVLGSDSLYQVLIQPEHIKTFEANFKPSEMNARAKAL